MGKLSLEEVVNGIRCEKCYPRAFGEMVNNSPENLYLYMDFGGNTRCFCIKHMSYCKGDSPALLNYEDEHDSPCFGAVLKSELLAPTPPIKGKD